MITKMKSMCKSILVVLALMAVGESVRATDFEAIQNKMNAADGLPAGAKYQTSAVVYCSRDIAKGQVIAAADVEERDIYYSRIPGDAATSVKQIVGKRAADSMWAGQIISLRDIGLPLTANQTSSMTARNWTNRAEPVMGSVCYTTVALKRGDRIDSDKLVSLQMPMRFIPKDAITSPSLAAARQVKFDCAKNHIIMQHDLAQIQQK